MFFTLFESHTFRDIMLINMLSNLNRNSYSIECRNFIKQRKFHMQINVRNVRYQETNVNLKSPFYKSIFFPYFVHEAQLLELRKISVYLNMSQEQDLLESVTWRRI